MALGYDHLAIAVQRGKPMADLVLEVSRRAIALQNVMIKGGKVKNLGLGSNSNRPDDGLLQGQPGSQCAFFVKNEKTSASATSARYRFTSEKMVSRASRSGCASTRPMATTTPPAPIS